MTIVYNAYRTNAILTRAILARGSDPRKVKRWVNRMAAEIRYRSETPRTSAYTAANRRQFLRVALKTVGK